MSPEVFDGKKYGFEVDMWAFGVTMYFMLNMEYPFSKSWHIIRYKLACKYYREGRDSERIGQKIQLQEINLEYKKEVTGKLLRRSRGSIQKNFWSEPKLQNKILWNPRTSSLQEILSWWLGIVNNRL